MKRPNLEAYDTDLRKDRSRLTLAMEKPCVGLLGDRSRQ